MANPAQHSPFATSASDRIDTLGEVALLDRIRRWLGDASPPAPQGIGDDCAVWPAPPPGEQLLFTTDAIVYGRHFDATCPPQLAAAKLLKRNLSDIAAMGGTPHSALLALTLPRDLSLRWLEAFYLGLRASSLRYTTPITGGDITEGTDHFFAAHITLIGHAKRPLPRTGAKPGDHLFVTGALGGSIRGHHLHFEPRLPEGRWLAAQPDVRAMIDLTDGLAKDLPHLLHKAEAEAASPLVEMSSGHFQRGNERGGSEVEDGERGRSGDDERGGSERGGNEVEDGELGRSGDDERGGDASEESGVRDDKDVHNDSVQRCGDAQADRRQKNDAQTDAVRPLCAEEPRVSRAAAETGAAATVVALLDCGALPPSAATRQDCAQTAPWSNAQTAPWPNAQDNLPCARALLLDGEDYELLFVVDARTDVAEFIARWQTHFGQTKAPAPGTPTCPQAAYPYYIGKVGLAANHPTGASLLYNAASGQPLPLEGGGFEHLKS